MSENSAPVSAAPRIAVRHVQLMRAILAAIAAVMITFSPDHAASYGLAVFSGFAITTALVFGFGAWMAYPAGRRWPIVLLAIVTVLAGMVSGIPVWRTTPVFFAIIMSWAAITGIIELVTGWADRRAMVRDGILDPQRASEARDAIVVGVMGVALALGVGLVAPDFRLDYFIDDAGQWFALTGISIGVGVFGAYAAVVAVFLGIAAFSPRRTAPADAGADVATSSSGESA